MLLRPLKRKNALAVLAMFVIVSILLTMIALAAVIDHECIGDGCPFCMIIKAAAYFFNTIKLIALFLFLAAALAFIIQIPSKKPVPYNPCICSPVILKVRLNT